MSKNTRVIILSVLAVLIVIVLSIGITTAFMKPVEQGGNLTEISLSSCAKIKLTGTSSVNLSNSYPMSRNKGLQTTPYNLTVTSYCDSYVGFNLYIATLNTNTMEASNIHYILTSKGSKDVIVEGILSEATNGASDFDDASKTELNAGLKGTYGNIYKIYNDSMSLKGNEEYDLYLFVDESSTNTSMNKTFKAGVAVKAYDRERSLAEYVVSQYTGTQGVNGIYYHDANLTNGAGDNSYRYAGANPNNYVCFGSDDATCPSENLYRIIGVIDGKIKLISADGATTTMLGTDEGYVKTYQAAFGSDSFYYKGNGDLTKIGTYKWNKSGTNTWSTSTTNTTNLNTNYLTYLDSKNTKWKTMIDDTTWYVGGMTRANGYESNAKTAYNYEVGANKDGTTVNAKIGLMYVSDYYYSASPSAWTLVGYNSSDATKDYRAATSTNWLYLGSTEWTISRDSGNTDTALAVGSPGVVGYGNVTNSAAARPSFNLESSVKYVSGSGSMSDPVRIN